MDKTTSLEALCLMVASLCASEMTIDLPIGEIAEIPEEEIPYEQLVERRGTSYQINASLPYSGYALKYHDNGQVSLRAIFLDGKREGVWKYFHDNGELLKEESYPNALDHIFVKTFDRNGNLNGYWPREDSYVSFDENEESESDKFISFFDNAGNEILFMGIASDINFFERVIMFFDNDDEITGPYYSLNEDGTISAVAWHEKGQWIGNDMYHGNGELAMETRHSESGSLIYQNIYNDIGYPVNFGRLEIFYPSGNTLAIYNVESGKLHGESIRYLNDGEGEFSQGNFINGLLEGELKTFDSNGELFAKSYYVEGKRNGRSFIYKDGRVSWENLWDMDKMVMAIMFDENGDAEECFDGDYNYIDCEDF